MPVAVGAPASFTAAALGSLNSLARSARRARSGYGRAAPAAAVLEAPQPRFALQPTTHNPQHTTHTTLPDLAATTAAPAAPSTSGSAADASASVVAGHSFLTPTEQAYASYLRSIAEAYLADHPEMAAPQYAGHVMRVVRARALGTPLSYDELMRSAVPAPADVPNRNSRAEVRAGLPKPLFAGRWDHEVAQSVLAARCEGRGGGGSTARA